MKDQGLAATHICICFLLALGLAIGCVKTPLAPTNEIASPLPPRPSPSGPSPTPVIAPSPASASTPETAATAPAAPVATPIATSTVAPPSTQTDLPTPVVLEPTDPYLAAVSRSPKLGGPLRSFLSYRSYGSQFDHLPGMKGALALIEQMGGVLCVVQFNRMLSDSEIGGLEKEYGIRFGRQDGEVQKFSRVYSVVIPIDKFAAFLALPDVQQIDSSVWN
ncbi:MAG: hypothetical protein HY673_10185 [Chloroflexi bacterium]|nr:hypothetical protein [Chloroflexota bacterium]